MRGFISACHYSEAFQEYWLISQYWHYAALCRRHCFSFQPGQPPDILPPAFRLASASCFSQPAMIIFAHYAITFIASAELITLFSCAVIVTPRQPDTSAQPRWSAEINSIINRCRHIITWLLAEDYIGWHIEYNIALNRSFEIDYLAILIRPVI